MVQWDQWTGHAVRLLDSTGTQLYLWTPATTVWFTELEVTYDEELEDRETVNGTRYPTSRGWRARLRVTMETLSGHFDGASPNEDLDNVIAYKAANAGSYWEVRLHSTPSSDWKRCNLLSGWKPKTLGKAAGLRITLEWEGAQLQTTAPVRDSGSLVTGGAW